jgi:hypothetical protein
MKARRRPEIAAPTTTTGTAKRGLGLRAALLLGVVVGGTALFMWGIYTFTDPMLPPLSWGGFIAFLISAMFAMGIASIVDESFRLFDTLSRQRVGANR